MQANLQAHMDRYQNHRIAYLKDEQLEWGKNQRVPDSEMLQ